MNGNATRLLRFASEGDVERLRGTPDALARVAGEIVAQLDLETGELPATEQIARAINKGVEGDPFQRKFTRTASAFRTRWRPPDESTGRRRRAWRRS